MTTSTTYKLTVAMPARQTRGLRAVAYLRATHDAGFTKGSLAVRYMR